MTKLEINKKNVEAIIEIICELADYDHESYKAYVDKKHDALILDKLKELK